MAVKIKTSTATYFGIYCDVCAEKIEFEVNDSNRATGHHDLETAIRLIQKDNWVVEQMSFPARENKDIRGIRCPKCEGQRKKALRDSEDLRDKLNGDYPFTLGEFEQAALLYVGLLKHPKGRWAFTKAWDAHGNYSDTLSELQELADLMKD
jgi:hypothetical protein